MSLFLMNRYLGEEEDESILKESRSESLLAKLQQKVKEKQRRSLTKDRRRLPEEQTEQQSVKKKRKADEDSGQEFEHYKKKKPTVHDLDSENDEPVEQKKTKKKQMMEEKEAEGVNGQKKKTKNLTGSTAKDLSGQEDREKEEEEEEEAVVAAAAEAKTGPPEQTMEKTSAPIGFKYVGAFENKPVQKVQRVLPQWLAQPDMIHRDIKNNLVPISDISGLSSALVKKLQDHGIQHFFPVQAEAIPAILENMQKGLLIGRGGYKPRDICVSAPTGSGKTLAFVIPVIQMLMERVVCEVRALAVLPTKELAQQVCKVFTSYTEGTPLKVVMLAGQRSFTAEQASLTEHRGGRSCSLADIVVATPGRLVDHISKNSGLCLQHLRFLIIDEADRMIDSMHQSWLSQVVKAVYKPRAMSMFRRTEAAYITAASLSPPQIPLQKLLFSATLTQNPEKLQQLGLHQPRLFSSVHSHSNSTAAASSHKQDCFHFPQGLTEYYVPCMLNKKPLLILHFILRMKLRPILCFTNSRETTHRLFLLVQLFGGVTVAEFSSRLSPGERKKKLKEFEQGKIQLLVSTDAAARGIDISGVKCVVNYDAPQYVRTYIHRIGRTARAGKAGLAFTFLLGIQEKKFLQMLVEAGSPGIQKQIVKPENLQSMEARFEQTLQELAKVIKSEKAK